MLGLLSLASLVPLLCTTHMRVVLLGRKKPVDLLGHTSFIDYVPYGLLIIQQGPMVHAESRCQA